MYECGITTLFLVLSVVINLILIIVNKTYYQYIPRHIPHTGESSCESPQRRIYYYRQMSYDDIEAGENKII